MSDACLLSFCCQLLRRVWLLGNSPSGSESLLLDLLLVPVLELNFTMICAFQIIKVGSSPRVSSLRKTQWMERKRIKNEPVRWHWSSVLNLKSWFKGAFYGRYRGTIADIPWTVTADITSWLKSWFRMGDGFLPVLGGSMLAETWKTKIRSSHLMS